MIPYKSKLIYSDALLTLEFNYTTMADGNQNVTIWEIQDVTFSYGEKLIS